MIKPVSYIKTSYMAQEAAGYVLNKYLNILQKNHNYDVLDVGCGPGNITYEKILPLLPKTTKNVIGVDISSDNVKYARKYYQMDPRVSYQQLDVLTDLLPNEYIGTFDLVISLYCLHFVGDHRKALINMDRMIKPRGNLLMSLINKSPFGDMYLSLHDNPKWRKYMGNFDKVVPAQHSIQYYKVLLEELGFGKIEFEEQEKYYLVPEDKAFGSLYALNLFKVPEHLEKDFIRAQLDWAERVDDKGKSFFKFPHNMLIISGNKL